MRANLYSVMLALLGAACGGGESTIDARPSVTYDADPPPVDAAGPDAGISTLPESPPEPVPTGDPNATLATFNTALAATIWYAPERKPHIIAKVKALAGDVDVLCLQEVWDSYAEDRISGPRELAGLLAPEWPYAFWDYTQTYPSKWGNGLLIVSKHPLYRGRSLRFVAGDTHEIIDRMVIAADVLMTDSYFHVLCTHLQAYDTEADIAVRQAEIAEVMTFATSEGYSDGPAFFLGDMNCGPQTAPCGVGECNEPDLGSYARLLEDWSDPNEYDAGVPNISGVCTFCEETSRPLQRLDSCGTGFGDCDPDVRLDHCTYLNIGSSALTNAEIVLDDIIEVTPAEGPACDGEFPCDEFCGGTVVCEPRDTQLSDHKGVKCSFASPAK